MCSKAEIAQVNLAHVEDANNLNNENHEASAGNLNEWPVRILE